MVNVDESLGLLEPKLLGSVAYTKEMSPRMFAKKTLMENPTIRYSNYDNMCLFNRHVFFHSNGEDLLHEYISGRHITHRLPKKTINIKYSLSSLGVEDPIIVPMSNVDEFCASDPNDQLDKTAKHITGHYS